MTTGFDAWQEWPQARAPCEAGVRESLRRICASREEALRQLQQLKIEPAAQATYSKDRDNPYKSHENDDFPANGLKPMEKHRSFQEIMKSICFYNIFRNEGP